MTIDASKVYDPIVEAMAYGRYVTEIASQLVPDLDPKRLRVVVYEKLQIDDEEEVNHILEWLGYSNLSTMKMQKSSTGRCSSNCTKNTSDDLRDVIENYKEVESVITANYSCLQKQFHVVVKGVFQPSVKVLCGDIFEEKIRSRIRNLLEITRQKVDNIF